MMMQDSTSNQPYSQMSNAERQTPFKPPMHGHSSSWDIFRGYEEFDARNASNAHLVYADGDIPKNKLVRFYNYLLNVSVFTRWFLFIVPVLGILWIPGVLSLTKFPNAGVWGVKLFWWSIWFSVVWGGWWVGLAASVLLPPIVRATIGLVAIGTRRYIDWVSAIHRYLALFLWSLMIWVTWVPVIDKHQVADAGSRSARAVDLIAQVLFAIFLCTALLLFEKFAIQWIAGKFHEKSYAERIADQKYAVRSLVTLYLHSSDIPGRTDTLASDGHKSNLNPRNIFRQIGKGVRSAAKTTTTALGNVASEITGSSVLQPNSPQAVVKTALESANKSRLLARRLFYSFAKPGAEYLFVDDIRKYFPDQEESERVFALFDKDGNGDISKDEIEMACLEFHREQLSIEHSMQDLDSAVGRLDNIFMSVYVVVAALIIAISLQASLAALVTGAGTLVLGLSWLIGGTLQEVLSSIIFLFIKHPFDVGDRVCLQKEIYTVKEIRLLSTVFIDGNGTCVQAPNTVLNTLFIQNFRRSPQMSETFTFDVGYSTSFEDLEKLREKMLDFVKAERRDYQPSFDVSVVDFPEQGKMTLKADIKYKSNFQQGALKAKRRNRWICALKTALAEVRVFGPTGDPNGPPSVTRYTEVPWSTIQKKDDEPPTSPTQRSIKEGWRLTDRNAALVNDSADIFGNPDELYMTTPRRGGPVGGAARTAGTVPGTSSSLATRPQETIEMTTRP